MRAQSGCRWCGDLCCVLIGQNRVTWYDCSSSQYMQDNTALFFLTRMILTVKSAFIFWARQSFLHSGHCQVLDSLVVRISACHVEGPGSIPGRGETFSFQRRVRFPSSTDITACDKFFRRHVGFTIRPNQPVLATPPEFDVDTVLASAVHILKLERYRED